MIPESNDTIAAIATAPGQGAIAIVRISGPESLEIANRMFRCRGKRPSDRPPGTFVHGYIVDPQHPEHVLDEAILLIFRAPKSYTREDVVEFQCHGGRICAEIVLRAAIACGARVAEPGEFTKRAFLNGRIDLVQAEAVVDLIRAKSEYAARCALEQLKGHLSSLLTRCYDILTDVLADIEAYLDFGDEEGISMDVSTAQKKINEVKNILSKCLCTWRESIVLRDGLHVVIAGRPNAGKSTLFNKLLGCDRSIVTEIPGTTRDYIEEQIVLDGIPIRLVDTAGLRSTECRIESHGVNRTISKVLEADVLLYVVDASEPPCAEDKANLRIARSDSVLVLLNKVDLGVRTDESFFSGIRTLRCSLLLEQGFTDIKRSIVELSSVKTGGTPHVLITERHRSVIQEIVESLSQIDKIPTSDPEYFTVSAMMIRSSLSRIGLILGKEWSQEVLGLIFSRFCVGK